jgi:transposase InsO family protein
VLRTPIRAPKANAYCERLVGTMGRECIDYLIPLSERHLRKLLCEWVRHYNQARPHSALGPGIPMPATGSSMRTCRDTLYRLVRASRRRQCWVVFITSID